MKKNIALVFGCKSPEHEVSIVTAFQAIGWIDRKKYNIYPVYITNENVAYLCNDILGDENPLSVIEDTLKKDNKIEFFSGGIRIKILKNLFSKKVLIDSCLLTTHGGIGENGALQGTLDYYQIPYTGSGVLGSALGMDKLKSKLIFKELGLNIANYVSIKKEEFKKSQSIVIKNIENKLTLPYFVKPVNLGSSIGITKVKNRKNLIPALKKAFKYDKYILVEESVEGAVDINCAVLGGDTPVVSQCAQPIIEEEVYSFKEKYLKGGKKKGMAGVSNIIPAPIPEKVAENIRRASEMIFKRFLCWGVVRVDFLYRAKTGIFYPNEINTIPGSLAYYLLEENSIKPEELIDRLINLSLERKNMRTNILSGFQSSILKIRN